MSNTTTRLVVSLFPWRQSVPPRATTVRSVVPSSDWRSRSSSRSSRSSVSQQQLAAAAVMARWTPPRGYHTTTTTTTSLSSSLSLLSSLSFFGTSNHHHPSQPSGNVTRVSFRSSLSPAAAAGAGVVGTRQRSGRSFSTTSAIPENAAATITITASSSSSSSSTKKSSKSTQPTILLYERHPDSQSQLILDFGVYFSTLHTVFWVWYNVDFIPHVNAAVMTQLHIDPTIGLVGLIFGIALQALCFVFPQSIISRLEYHPRPNHSNNDNNNNNNHKGTPRGELHLYTHTLFPLVRPKLSRPKLVAPLGQLVLEPHSIDTQTILNDHQGNMALFQGYVGLVVKQQQKSNPDDHDDRHHHRRHHHHHSPATRRKNVNWIPYLMDIQQPEDVPEPTLLLQAVLAPEEFGKGTLSLSSSRGGKNVSAVPRGRPQPRRGRKR